MALSTVAQAIRQRAQFCCEYCLLPSQVSIVPFEIDHIIAKKHGGASESSNLALSCFYCNSAKGPNIAGIDPTNGAIVPLYHPRRDRWNEHFRIVGNNITGQSPRARATIAVLEMNAEDMLLLRDSLISEGLYPPNLDFGTSA